MPAAPDSPANDSIEPAGHRSTLTVRFADIDLAGIVYYPRFLHYCHVAMEEHFAQALDLPYPELVTQHRLGFPAVSLETTFRRPLRYGDEVDVDSRVVRVGASSVEWRYALRQRASGELAAEARVTTVCVGLDDFARRDVPAWLRERLLGATPPDAR